MMNPEVGSPPGNHCRFLRKLPRTHARGYDRSLAPKPTPGIRGVKAVGRAVNYILLVSFVFFSFVAFAFFVFFALVAFVSLVSCGAALYAKAGAVSVKTIAAVNSKLSNFFIV
jgi:hypothetical protein